MFFELVAIACCGQSNGEHIETLQKLYKSRFEDPKAVKILDNEVAGAILSAMLGDRG